MRRRVVNIVAVAVLSRRPDLKEYASRLSRLRGLRVRLNNNGLRVRLDDVVFFIFPTGRVMIFGAKSKEQLLRACRALEGALRRAGLDVEVSSPQLKNVVIVWDIGREVDIEALSLVDPNAEYEPEIFPGCVYKLRSPRSTFIVFRSGKVVHLCPREDQIDSTFRALCERLSELGVLR